jgi:hypothetical protein
MTEKDETPSTVWTRLLPRRIDNVYDGSKIGLWILGLVLLMRALQSIMIIFNGYSVAQSADGIPLETYPAAAAQTILAIFAISSLNRLIISGIGAVVLVRYRRAVPFMFLVVLTTYAGAQILAWFIPIVRVGRPVGVMVNLGLFGLTIIGLILSLWKRR